MPRKSKKTDFFFTLENINTEQIDHKYGIAVVSNITEDENPNPSVTTKINDLLDIKKSPEIVSFLDESKHSRKCTISMVDFITNKQIQNGETYKCFWDGEFIPESVQPIGCPVKYNAHQGIKHYYSEITKDWYTIKENVTKTRFNELGKNTDKRIAVIDRDYYLTDGIFCSFNCCMAYIDFYSKIDSLYRDSATLLLKMYNTIHPEKVNIIEPAPHWRKLKCYGGNLT